MLFIVGIGTNVIVCVCVSGSWFVCALCYLNTKRYMETIQHNRAVRHHHNVKEGEKMDHNGNEWQVFAPAKSPHKQQYNQPKDVIL